MAETIPFKETNGTMGVGANDPEKVTAIPVAFGQRPDGMKETISCWKLTQEELDEAKRTGVIWLSVMGHGMPPVYITALSPFEPDECRRGRVFLQSLVVQDHHDTAGLEFFIGMFPEDERQEVREALLHGRGSCGGKPEPRVLHNISARSGFDPKVTYRQCLLAFGHLIENKP